MKFKNLIFVMTITFSVIFAVMIGSSYAYYIATDGTTVEVTTGNLDVGVSVSFEHSQYINVNTGVPINDADADTLAKSSVFTITPDKTILNGAEVMVTITLRDLYIDEVLRSEDFKYSFSCNNGGVSTSGTGLDFDDVVVKRKQITLGTLSTVDGSFNINNPYTCTLRLWLTETGLDQNDLMNKRISGLIKVNTIFKK